MNILAGLSGGVRIIGNRPADTFRVRLTQLLESMPHMILLGPAHHDQNSTILPSISGPPARWNGITRIAFFALICVVDCKGLVHLGQ
jgi:hypothetical protein